jgi:hypothetical protein
MGDSKERSDAKTKVKTDDLFTKLSARGVPLTKADLRKARTALTALQAKKASSSNKVK